MARCVGDCRHAKRLAAHLYRATKQRFPGSEYKALNTFLLTRFFLAAVSAPDTFGLLRGVGALARSPPTEGPTGPDLPPTLASPLFSLSLSACVCA